MREYDQRGLHTAGNPSEIIASLSTEFLFNADLTCELRNCRFELLNLFTAVDDLVLTGPKFEAPGLKSDTDVTDANYYLAARVGQFEIGNFAVGN